MFRVTTLASCARSLLAAAALVALAAPTTAHHTFVNKYDGSKLVTVSGTVDSVSFGNPHIFFSVGGWYVETEGVAVANSRGLKAHLKEGAKVTVRGWKSRDGSSSLGLSSISFSGGPTISMRGSAR